MSIFSGTSVLITGGTGSLGQEMTKYLLNSTNVRRVAIYSRDELKQYTMQQTFKSDKRLRFFLGDVRDLDRLKMALNDVDFVIHAAALKQVDTGEYNPMEFIKTNILGSQNLIEAAIHSGVKKTIALSTDKASSPINLYGATKLTADKLFIAANNYSFKRGTIFSVVRYGNVIGSRGSVIPLFNSLVNSGKNLTVTDKRMTRFWISMPEAIKFICDSFVLMKGGELFVPKIPSLKIIDLAKIIGPNSKIVETGIRPGEKLHEEMISLEDSRRTIITDSRFTVMPVQAEWGYERPIGAMMTENTSFRSDTNELWVTKEQILKIIKNLDLVHD
jgi:UDP-N-acetylglucosamine 4,6-dehydratase